jgi:predicted alpha/beta-hydrolase family hydrolase
LQPRALSFAVDAAHTVSGLLTAPPDATAGVVLAHGAGAGMNQAFLAAAAAGLAERGVATLRYQFPYMEEGRGRPDAPGLAAATVRAAVLEAGRRLPGLPLVAAGKSFGGRMSSTAASEAPLPGVVGLAFLGFPLHPPGKPSDARAEHLAGVTVPMLFLQGTRDDFADLALLRPVVERLGRRATLRLFQDADHSFHVPARSGRKDADIRAELLDALAAWIAKAAKQKRRRA